MKAFVVLSTVLSLQAFGAELKYNAPHGRCENVITGKPGLRNLNSQGFLACAKAKDCSCTDLRKIAIFGQKSDGGYLELSGVDLRGANLESARLEFVLLMSSQLEGTNFSKIVPAYNRIDGTIDASTKQVGGSKLPNSHCSLQSKFYIYCLF